VWVDQKKYRTVGAALERAREQAGFTQKELARALRKPQSFISNFERGQRRIDVLELLRIVDALGADPEQIFLRFLQPWTTGRGANGALCNGFP
jgi:transcriptional regulator with XRE-family HTH domain